MTAGLVPLFTSAPRLRLHINEKSVAYAIGFNMNIAIDVQPVQVIGQFSAMALEPTVYNVITGTIQVTKLVSGTTKVNQAGLVQPENLIGSDITQVKTQVKDGSAIAEQTSNIANVQANSVADANSILSLQGLHAHLDPSKVLASRTFDMDVYLTVPTAQTLVAATASAPGTAQLSSNGVPVRWLRIKYCRLVSRNTNIAQGQLVNEPVNFQGLLATTVINDQDMFQLDSLIKEVL